MKNTLPNSTACRFTWFAFYEPYFIEEECRDVTTDVDGSHCYAVRSQDMFETPQETLNNFLNIRMPDTGNISDDRAILHIIQLTGEQQTDFTENWEKLIDKMISLDDEPAYESYKLLENFASSYPECKITISDYFPRIESCITERMLEPLAQAYEYAKEKLLKDIKDYDFDTCRRPRFALFAFNEPDFFFETDRNLEMSGEYTDACLNLSLYDSAQNALSGYLNQFRRTDKRCTVHIACLLPEEQKTWHDKLDAFTLKLKKERENDAYYVFKEQAEFAGSFKLPVFTITPSQAFPYMKDCDDIFDASTKNMINQLNDKITDHYLNSAACWEYNLKGNEEYRSAFPAYI